jgi:hypothetical protein
LGWGYDGELIINWQSLIYNWHFWQGLQRNRFPLRDFHVLRRDYHGVDGGHEPFMDIF